MAVDLLRSAYETDVRFWADSEDTARIRWYRVTPGTPFIPFATIFSSYVWDGENGPRSNICDGTPLQGESNSSDRKFDHGDLPPQPLPGTGVCGTAAQWAGQLTRAANPPLGENVLDQPTCCPGACNDFPERPEVDDCPVALGPQWAIYAVPAFSWGVNRIPETPQASADLPNTAPCLWALLIPGAVHPQVTTYQVIFNADGTATLRGFINDFLVPANVMTWTSDGPVLPSEPFRVKPVPPPGIPYFGPSEVTITGKGLDFLRLLPCGWLNVGTQASPLLLYL